MNGSTSKNSLWQLYAIARTEARFGIRRGWPVVGTAAVSGVMSLIVFWQTSESASALQALGLLPSSLAQVWMLFVVLVPIVLTLSIIPVIPVDREYGVFPWLFTQPITGGTYLAGKLLGTLFVVLCTWVICLALHMLAFRIWVGPFDLALDLRLAGLGGLPLLAWVVAVAVLLGAWIHRRRSAILVGSVMGIFNFLAWTFIFRGLAVHLPPVFDVSDRIIELIVRLVYVDMIVSRIGSLSRFLRPLTIGDALWSILLAYLALAILAGAARLHLLKTGNI